MTFKVGEKVHSTVSTKTGTVVVPDPDSSNRIIVLDSDGDYFRVGLRNLVRVHPTRYVVEYREPKALEYILPSISQYENEAGLYFIHFVVVFGAEAYKGEKRFCVVETLEDGETYERSPRETVRSIERRIPNMGDLYLSDMMSDDDGRPMVMKANGLPHKFDRDVIVENPVKRPIQYVIERTATIHDRQLGIDHGTLVRYPGAGWTVLETLT